MSPFPVATPAGPKFEAPWAAQARPFEVTSGPDRSFGLAFGTGTPVLLLHGYACDLGHWRSLGPSLAAAGFQALAVDLPGHGHASRFERTAPPETFIDAAIATLEQEAPGAETVHLLGHSMGGAVALEVGRRLGKRLGRTVLLGPALPGYPLSAAFGGWMRGPGRSPFWGPLLLSAGTRFTFKLSLGASIAGLQEVLARKGEGLVDEAYDAFKLPGTAASLAGTARGFLDGWERVLTTLPKLGESGLLFWGTEDGICSYEGAAKAAEALGCRLETVKGGGHCPHLERAAWFDALVIAHLRGVAAGGVGS